VLIPCPHNAFFVFFDYPYQQAKSPRIVAIIVGDANSRKQPKLRFQLAPFHMHMHGFPRSPFIGIEENVNPRSRKITGIAQLYKTPTLPATANRPLHWSPMPRTSPPLFPDTPASATVPAWVTAHCDGGARGNPGPAGYGAQICDDHGHTLAELSEFLGNRTNNFAEYSGLLGCLQWALDHHHKSLRVVSDSELMVKQIQGLYKVKSPDLLPLWQEAKRRIAQLDNFQITHALRHKNKEADRLANEAMDRGTQRPRTAGNPAPQPAPASSRSDSGTRESSPAAPKLSNPTMHRGFTRNGVIHLLGNVTLPDGVFVKIITED
jgi:ribonuclease HI